MWPTSGFTRRYYICPLRGLWGNSNEFEALKSSAKISPFAVIYRQRIDGFLRFAGENLNLLADVDDCFQNDKRHDKPFFDKKGGENADKNAEVKKKYPA